MKNLSNTKKNRHRLVEILMRRDNESEEEANDRIDEVVDQLRDYVDEADLFGAEDLIMQDLGLEADYIDDLLDEI